MQGKIERGHADYKKAYQKWMMIGAFAAMHKINK
jgi:hypothetical protein